MYESEGAGRRDRGRFCMRWLEVVKKACNVRSTPDAKFVWMNREQKTNFGNGTNGGVNV